MYGLHNLKTSFQITTTNIECPVLGCPHVVRRRREDDEVRDLEFLCADCGIYIYPSTFEYVRESDNFLWSGLEDVALLNKIKQFKAEKERLGRERSEDAVSWNVFRHFDRMQRLDLLVRLLSSDQPNNDDVEIVYWSVSGRSRTPWKPRMEARAEFGEASSSSEAETAKHVSEPDLILITSTTVAFVEAKFGSSNNTSGKPKDVARRVANPKRYVIGGGDWYRSVFRSDYRTVVEDQKYELLRFWLLGSWIAARLNRRFVLVNLVSEGREKHIESSFGKHILQSEERSFVRRTWESIYRHLPEERGEGETELLREYFRRKTFGLIEDRRSGTAVPRKAFNTH